MKKFIIFLFVILVGNNIHSYSQSNNYTQYYNQAMQKAQSIGAEIGKSLQSSSQFAMRSTNKDIYVLYLNGNRMACFSDEWSCKAQINSIKLRMESLLESTYNGLPAEAKRQIGNQWRNDIKNVINSFHFTYQKEPNPNYHPSMVNYSKTKTNFDANDSSFPGYGTGLNNNQTVESNQNQKNSDSDINSLPQMNETGQVSGGVLGVSGARETAQPNTPVNTSAANKAPEIDISSLLKAKDSLKSSNQAIKDLQAIADLSSASASASSPEAALAAQVKVNDMMPRTNIVADLSYLDKSLDNTVDNHVLSPSNETPSKVANDYDNYLKNKNVTPSAGGIVLDDTHGPLSVKRPSTEVILAPEIKYSISESTPPVYHQIASDNGSNNFDRKGWAIWGIDAAKYGLGFLIRPVTPVGMLLTANYNLYGEIIKYCIDPYNYKGDILYNAAINTLVSISISNSATIAGTWFSGAKAANGLPANLSYSEAKALLKGQAILKTGKRVYGGGKLAVKAHNLASEDKK